MLEGPKLQNRLRPRDICVLLALGICMGVFAAPAQAQLGSAGSRRIPVLQPPELDSASPVMMDTLLVDAQRVTVEEVMRHIARKMEEENLLHENSSFTSLATVVVRFDDKGEQGRYELIEEANRHHLSNSEGEQIVRLWTRTRKYEDGELKEEETDEDLESEYLGMEDPAEELMPFSTGSGGRYEYEILARDLVGNSLIYEVRFAPRSRFDALPAGTVWVDYSNWVIRKVEAQMSDAVPYPWILKGIPVWRMSRERFGEHWFTTDMYFEIELQTVPLMGIPPVVEVRVQLTNLVINGVPYDDEGNALAPTGAAQADSVAASPLVGEWLMSAEASTKSLDAYWSGMEQRWHAELSPEAGSTQWNRARVDSLSLIGDQELADLRAGRKVEVSPSIPPGFRYNRVQGPVLRMKLGVAVLGPNRPHLELLAGYGFSNKLPVYGFDAGLPLLKSHWTRPGQRGVGRQYTKLGLRLSGSRNSKAYAGDDREIERTVTALIYGSDPNHWFEQRELDAALDWQLARRLTLSGGGGWEQHASQSQHTDWNLLGRSLRPDGNRQVDNLGTRFLALGADWSWGALSMNGKLRWDRVNESDFVSGLPGSPDSADFRRWEVGARIKKLDGAGNAWLLKGAFRSVDRRAPIQWRSWMGDYGTLRGYRAGELAGDEAAWASLDLRLDFDLWRSIKMPVLKHWGLQPIVFVDWAWTQDQDGPISTGAVDQLYPQNPAWGPGLQDWRADLGFGFGRRFDLPLFSEKPNLRFYLAHPVGEGSEDHGWRFLIAFEP